MAQFSLVKGRRTSKNSRYLDALPVNMIPVPAEAPNDSGYLRSFKGISHLYDCSGPSYSALYNDLDDSEYRVVGIDLLKDGKSVGELINPVIANMAHSKLSTAFIDNGIVKYYRDGEITELKNWSSGENFVSYPDWKFTPNFETASFVVIPNWNGEGGAIVSFNFYVKELPSDDQFIIGSSRADSNFSGVFYKGSDKKFYVRFNGKDIFVQDCVEGDNFVSVSTDSEFQYPISYIGAVKTGQTSRKNTKGQITNLLMYSVSDASKFREYPLIIDSERDSEESPPKPSTRIIENTNDDTGATNGVLNGGWYNYHSQSDPVRSDPTSYDLTGVIDIDRHQGRYVWLNKNSFGCTALTIGSSGNQNTSPEQRPDYAAAIYTPESDPDDNRAIRSFLGNYVAVFGRYSTEFFRLTGDAGNIYSPQKNMETQAGIVATGAVCHFMDNFAAIGSKKGDSLGVIMIGPGSSRKISTATIDRELAAYKESELNSSLVESVTMDNHTLLFVHLPKNTFVFDGSANTWVTLKSGISDDNSYTGRHVIVNPELGVTIGDKNKGRVGLLTDDVSSQYGEDVEHLLYTPYIKVSQGKKTVPLFDLSFDSIYGHSSKAQSLMISATTDGRTYSAEHYLTFNEPIHYTNTPLISSVGSVNDSVGFKMRFVTKDNVAISGFNVRVGLNG